jgi:hypothetical protein
MAKVLQTDFAWPDVSIERAVIETATFNAVVSAYRPFIDWEDPLALEGRAATLLPMLALARIDGKSPVEYLGEADRSALRSDARAAIERGATTLAEVAAALLR